MLEKYQEIYDIKAYKEKRNDVIEYLVREIVFHGYSYAYLIDIYNIIKEREPELINGIEQKLTVSNLLNEKNYLKKTAESRQRVLRAYKTLSYDGELNKVRKYSLYKKSMLEQCGDYLKGKHVRHLWHFQRQIM
jgi:hypothetical protein